MALSPREVYDLAIGAGLSPDQAVVATAVAWGESDLNPSAVGDLSLQDGTWGPSIGLWQVRSLKAHRGTGQTRDADRLTDPAFNAQATVEISENGTNWNPWTIYRSGAYQQYLDAVQAAVGGTQMETWHPRAQRVEPQNTVPGDYRVDCPWKLVVHTVEGGGYTPSRQNYYGHQSYPHFTVGADGIYQHFPIDLAARALYNAAGGAETNAARAIQVEVVWWAGRIQEIPDATLANLADLANWVIGQGLIPATFAQFAGDGAYGENAPQRFDKADWYGFSGICGHQHVPENDHWDPGDFPVDRFRALLNAPQEDELTQEQANTLRYIADVLTELKTQLCAAADTDNWHEVGQRLKERLDRIK